MNNREKSKPIIVAIVIVLIAFILPIFAGGILRQSVENLTNGALAIIASIGFTVWEIDYNQKENKKKKLKLDQEKLEQENRKNERTARLEIDSLLFLMNDFPNLISENKRINIIQSRSENTRKSNSDNNKLIQNMLERVKNYRSEFYKNIHGVERALILLESTTDEEIESILENVNRLQSDFYDLGRDLEPSELENFGFMFLQCKKEDIVQEMINLQKTFSDLKIGQNQNYQDKISCLNGYIVMTKFRSIVDNCLENQEEVSPKDIAKELDKKANNVDLPQEVKRYGDGSKDKARFIMKLWILRNDHLKDNEPYSKKNPIVEFGKYNKIYGTYYLRMSNSETDSSDSTVYTKISWSEPTKEN